MGLDHQTEILTEVFVMDELRTISHSLKKIPKNKRNAFLKYKLTQFPFPKDGFTFPIDSRHALPYRFHVLPPRPH